MSSLKLKHSGGNSVIIAGPSSNPAADRTINLNDNYAGDGSFVTANSSGNVGIGTASPSNLLHLKSGSPAIRLEDTDANGSAFSMVEDSNGLLKLRNDAGNAGTGSGITFEVDASERMRIDTSGRLLVNSTSTSIASKLISTIGTGTGVTWGQCGLAVTHASGANTKSLIGFGFSGNGGSYPPAAIGSFTNSTSGNENNNLAFFTRSATSDTEASERMRINSDGVVMLNSTYAGSSTNGDPIMLISPRISQTTKSMGIKFQARADVYDVTHIQFEHGVNQQVMGNITSANAGATSYNTSSDYRLKENVVNLSNGITRLKTLKPKRFNFIIDEAKTLVDGFLAHEVTAVPEAITGTKDEVDSDNKPVYQGIDQSKLVPLLTAALQEAITKIETLETKVAALEAA